MEVIPNQKNIYIDIQLDTYSMSYSYEAQTLDFDIVYAVQTL